jgi:hypothetical protein
MASEKKPARLVMSQIKSGTIFKLTGEHQIGKHALTLAGVYRMAVARADHGRVMRIYDIATTRLTALGGTESGPLIDIPSDQAKTIETYVILN